MIHAGRSAELGLGGVNHTGAENSVLMRADSPITQWPSVSLPRRRWRVYVQLKRISGVSKAACVGLDHPQPPEVSGSLQPGAILPGRPWAWLGPGRWGLGYPYPGPEGF